MGLFNFIKFSNRTEVVNRYFKRYWDETTGDPLTESWGTSTYYFEVDQEGKVIRQLQSFSSGKILKYNSEHLEDEYGFLSDQPLDFEEFNEFEIGKEEFDKEWQDQSG